MRTTIRSLVTPLVLLCFGLLPQAEAVVPPPDGGYPNFTTAEGQNALFSLTTGAANTAVGWFSLKSVTAGSFNTGVGAGTLVLNTGAENTAIGTAALLLNTASGNTAVGSRALLNNTTGGTLGNIQGVDVGPNVAVGQQALESNIVASANTAVGYQALQSFTTGPLGLEQIGLCTAVGFQALANATGLGFANSAFGYHALMNNTDGGGNTAIGLQALVDNTIGSSNVAIGNNALSNSTGDSNIALGFNAGAGVSTASNVICIGALGANMANSCFIGNIYSNVQPIVGTDPDSVTIASSGRLGRGNVSSRRYKHDIKSMDKASEVLYALKPVSFRYNKEYDATQTLAFGLIAEEVAEVYPDLVGRNPKGEPESVRYEQINAMLLNEFLKEYKTVQELKSTVLSQQSVIAQQRESFERRLAEQAKQIKALTDAVEKVNAQLEMNNNTPRVAANEP
jgi:trimeric autotransporter adhesin